LLDFKDGHTIDDCLAITDNATKATVKLAQARTNAASVVVNSTSLWLSGGYLNNIGKTRTTEFVELNGTRPGPDLPLVLSFHCLVSLNETIILLIGGKSNEATISATFYYNIDFETWTEGPPLITARFSHSCALFKSPLHNHNDTVIVTGGYIIDINDENIEQSSTEFLNLDSNLWTSGNQHLPEHT
jgi:hypothetical protein